MLIKLKDFKTSNECLTLGVEPDNNLLLGRENSHESIISSTQDFTIV